MGPMSRADAAAASGEGEREGGGTLGTFAGVFTPSILTILGIILFLRLGFVVGAAGLGRALAIIAFANVISILTSISLSAIATNLRVKGGGDYFLISRTLGVEYGGALGIVLFLAQSVSIAFYAIGFGEACTAVLGADAEWLPQAVAAGAVALLFVLAWFGADVATRFQYVVMAVLAAGLVAFFAGGIPQVEPELLRKSWAPSSNLGFWVVFAIFFPAVTGFTQGVSMSGDLKDPARSLPLGTFMAVSLSAVVYFAVAVVFAGSVPGRELVSDYSAMRRVSVVAGLVDAGVLAATLSSALASFLGAPRILQSLARDRVFPLLTPFAAGHGPSENPRRGVLLAAAIAFATIAMGSLNLIAPVVAMFFLVSYGLLNYATWFEARGRSPSFRPTFRWFHPRLCLLGFIACAVAMFAINPTAGAVAVALLFGVHQYVKRTVTTPRWADGERSYHLQRVRERLIELNTDPDHPRDWRPVIVAFSDDPGRRARTIEFASWLEGGSGFTTAVRLLEGEGALARQRRAEVEAEILADIAQRELQSFARVVTAADPAEAMPVILQSLGLGAVRSNTVLLNWFDHAPGPEDPPGLERYGRYLRLALRFECNVVILSTTSASFEAVKSTPSAQRRIDVWYVDETHGPLSLLFAYLMTRTRGWDSASIRLCAPATDDRTTEEVLVSLGRMLKDVRISAEPHVVETWSEETLIQESAAASLVFLPFRLEGDTPKSVFEGPLNPLLSRLRVVALVHAAQTVDLDAEPDEGGPAEVAVAEDRAADAEAVARRAEKQAERAAKAVEKASTEVEHALADERKDVDEVRDAAAAVREAEREAEAKRRRALKARVKAEDAKKEADQLSGRPESEPEDGDSAPES
jgi:amino acid transporter